MFAQSPFIGSCSILGFRDRNTGKSSIREIGYIYLLEESEESVRRYGWKGEYLLMIRNGEKCLIFEKIFKGVRKNY